MCFCSPAPAIESNERRLMLSVVLLGPSPWRAPVIGILSVAVCLTFGPKANCSTVVRFNTVLGNIDVRLYDGATPLTVANFLNYVNNSRYNGTFIHRSV